MFLSAFLAVVIPLVVLYFGIKYARKAWYQTPVKDAMEKAEAEKEAASEARTVNLDAYRENKQAVDEVLDLDKKGNG